MEYKSFEYVAPTWFGIPLLAIGAILLVGFALLSAYVSWRLLDAKKFPAKTAIASVIVGLLLASTIFVAFSGPSGEEQFETWNSELTEAVNAHYGLKLTEREFAYLNSVVGVSEGFNYGPTLQLKNGDAPEDFSSYILTRNAEELHILRLIGADYVELPQSNKAQ